MIRCLILFRTLCTAALLCLLLSGWGCTMCQHPYDYCGPTFTGDNCVPCNPMGRAGSILSPQLPTAGSDYAEGQLVPGSEVIYSEGDLLQDEVQHPTPAPPPQPEPVRKTFHASPISCPQCQRVGR